MEHVKSKHCTMNIQILKESSDFLKSLYDKEYEEKGDKQTEFSGLFYIQDIIERNDKSIVFLFAINQDSFKRGQKETTYVDWGTASYHSHPKAAYLRKDVKYAWPSTTDFIGFYELKDIIFHCVSSREGLYIISYNKNWDKNNSYDEKIIKDYIIEKYKLNRNENSPQDFLNKINKLTYPAVNGKQIFEVQYFPWEQCCPVFTVYFNKSKDTCNIDDIVFKIHEENG